jgi:hypothetical protein
MKNVIFASRKLVFDTMFSYIKDKLLFVPQLEEWKRDINDSNTFLFSLSPQVCVSEAQQNQNIKYLKNKKMKSD